MSTAANASQNPITPTRRAVHQTSFLCALVQAWVRAITPRPVAATGAGLPLGDMSSMAPRCANRSRVTDESYPRSRWTVGGSGNGPNRFRRSRVGSSRGESWRAVGATTVPRGMPAPSTTVERFRPCLPRRLAAARGLGGAAIYRQAGQVEADHPVIGGHDDGGQALHDPVGDPPRGAAEDKDLDELVEDDPIRSCWLISSSR